MAHSHLRSIHHLLLLLLSVVLFPSSSSAAPSSTVGVNYGQLGNNLPSPTTSLRLIRAVRAGSVKLYDANPAILQALSGTGLKVAIMLPNQLIPTVAANRSAADAWVAANLVPFLPAARIRYLLVGNEVLSDFSVRSTTWPNLVPAMYNVKAALDSAAAAKPSSGAVRDALRRVKVGTTVAVDAFLNGSYARPPSSARFRPEYAETVLKPLLKFLKKTNSYYFLDAYTYFSWAPARAAIPLGYALLEDGAQQQLYVDPGTGLRYANLLQELLDATAYAMTRLGYPDLRLALAETGWPNGGDYDQAGANPKNAAVYNRNLAKWARAGLGTPLRPAGKLKGTVPVWVFSLYNENLKTGPGTERHWGLYYPTTAPVFGVDLSGRTPDTALPPLPPASPQGPYNGKIWCVVARAIAAAKPGTNGTEIGNAVAYACGQANGTCAALSRSPCVSGTVVQRASYAFNAYWQQFKGIGATCYFNGLAEQVIRDPSFGSCRFPSLSG